MSRLLVWLKAFMDWLPTRPVALTLSLFRSLTMLGGTYSLVANESMNEGDSNYPLPERRHWSNLPQEILEQIFGSMGFLGILDILSVRGICREWRRLAPASEPTAVSSLATPRQLWFLLYGKDEYPNCALYDPRFDKVYNEINIPELGKDVVCIASNCGWLLLYRESNRSLFFLCPFSRAKIDLPNLPDVEEGPISRRIAAFSSPPTSPDCIVCVCTQTDYSPDRCYTKFVLNVLRRGANHNNNGWDNDTYELRHTLFEMGTARCAAVWERGVYFLDNRGMGVGFSLEENHWIDLHQVLEFRTRVRENYYGSIVQTRLGLSYNDFLYVRGAVGKLIQVQRGGDYDDNYGNEDGYLMTYMYDEEVGGAGFARKIYYRTNTLVDDLRAGLIKVLRRLHLIGSSYDVQGPKVYKGVWLQPCFYQLPPNYNW